MTTTFISRTSSEIINAVLQAYTDVFSSKTAQINVTQFLQPAVIDTDESGPIKELEILIDNIIRKNESLWASPLFVSLVSV